MPKATPCSSRTFDIPPQLSQGILNVKKKNPGSKEIRLRKKLIDARKKCYRLKMQVHRTRHARPTTAAEVAQVASNFMSPVAHKLFCAQLTMFTKRKYGRRWTGDMKDFALSLFLRSPLSYRFLRKILFLPSRTTLKRFQARIPLNTGVHKHFIDFLRDEVPSWSDEKKLCTLVFDEVSIKRNLHYDVQTDKIVGLVDRGFSRKNVISNQALVAMVKGTVTSWKQVVGHWFTASGDSATSIHEALYQCLQQLKSVGLIVKLVICVQEAKTTSIIEKMGITPETPFFTYENDRIFFMWDPPHLIKSMRNNLMAYNFKWKNGVAKWDHILTAVKCDDPLRPNLLPKVHSRHVDFKENNFRKMKVKLATQVLSRSMSTALMVLQMKGILPADSVHTADCLDDLNDLFDCFNSTKRFGISNSSLSYRYAISSSSRHKLFLQGLLKHLARSQFLECPRQPDCLHGWILNIRSLLMLSGHLLSNYEVKDIRTRLLNQDALENTLSIVRQQHGCSDHPTAKQIEDGLKAWSLSSMSKLASSTNCEDELERALVCLSKLKYPSDHGSWDENEQEESLYAPDVTPLGSIEGNAFYYCCGLITKKFLTEHHCDVCKCQILVQPTERSVSHNYQLFTDFKAYSEALGKEFGNLHLPAEQAFDVFQKMEGIFFSRFHVIAQRAGIARIIMDSFNLENLSLNLCSESAEIFFKEIFIRTRVYWEIISLNRKLEDPECEKITTIKKLYKVL